MEAPLEEIRRVKISNCVIPIYGATTSPLFDATYIAYILGMQNHRTTTRFFSSAEYIVVCIRNNNRSHRAGVLTLAGLKRLVLSRGVNKLTKAILKWIALVEDALTIEVAGYDEQTPSELDEANQTIAGLQNELYQSQSDIISKDSDITRLNRENEQLKMQLQSQQRDIANEHKDIEIARLNDALLKSDEQNQQLNHLMNQLQLFQCENDTANVQLRTELADVIARSRSFRSAIVKAKSTHSGIVAALRDHDPI